MRRENRYPGFWKEIRSAIVLIVVLSCVCFILSALFSCSPRVISTELEVHDTCYVARTEYRDLLRHDSIYITERQKGDTIYLTTYKEVTAYRDVQVHDTCYVAQVETLEVEKPVYQQTRCQKAFSVMGMVFAGLVLLAILYWLFIFGATRHGKN